ncbi:23S rRNA (uracil(1939)-C(5))-methyltransferase RlmD [Thiomicrorhabdus cannonii]|uniref:23S rRNA (uracil(1939)-C(5))-methyltransferase RlmD n=1 Tax=Thiomicrorhabdus cannonii TaxID=2748011 RepID=UPI0015C086B5|nr:23S rRNA (uracil(1939)-C(5))-methyltransferase RlmD [Thiomicrorhabdus cannonii]
MKNIQQFTIEGITHDGRGVARLDGKAVFIDGAVPGDVVNARLVEHQPKFDVAQLLEIEQPSAERTAPFCEHYNTCGGCQLQHLTLDAQRYWKAENFITRLTQAVDAKQCQIAAPLIGAGQAYRRRARFGLAISKHDKQARLGFRQKASNELVDIPHCPVLSDTLNATLAAQREEWLSQASRAYKEITLVEADNGVFVSGAVEQTPAPHMPFYTLDGLQLRFPSDGFIQVNADINRQMVKQALEWLELQPQHRVLDLFCGIGNFTLPIGRQVKQAIGVEGLEELVATANDNAKDNQLPQCQFYKTDLFDDVSHQRWFKKQRYDRVLLDPGRQGAFEISKTLHQLKPELIVYVSCNAATLIRDIKELEKQGYRLTRAGLIDMFPHTTHTEVMVQLKKTKTTQTDRKKRPAFKF